MIGAQATGGTVLRRQRLGTPNLELGFGEITDLIALNLEGVLRMPHDSTSSGASRSSLRRCGLPPRDFVKTWTISSWQGWNRGRGLRCRST